jgi:hypothetical protein
VFDKPTPTAFLKIISGVLPREVLLKATLNVTTTSEYEDFAQYLADWRMARQRIGNRGRSPNADDQRRTKDAR